MSRLCTLRRSVAATALALSSAAAVAPSAHAAATPFNLEFQPATVATPAGYGGDVGNAYTPERGFGWIREDSVGAEPVPLDATARTRARPVASSPDPRLRTLIQLSQAGEPNAAWQVVANPGYYQVTLSAGDPSYVNSRDVVNVEGKRVMDFTPAVGAATKTVTATVLVTDGLLTIDGIGGTNVKLNYVSIIPTEPIAVAGLGIPAVAALDTPGAITPDLMLFSRIKAPDASPSQWGHPTSRDVSTLRITNVGPNRLTVTDLPITTGAEYFRLAEPRPVLPLRLEADESVDIAVQFYAPFTEKTVRRGVLSIVSNSRSLPVRNVPLSGFIQEKPEGEREPSVQQVVNGVFGYATDFGTKDDAEKSTFNRPRGRAIPSGSEVISPYWRALDPSKPVGAVQLAAYHGRGNETLSWFNQGSFRTTAIMRHRDGDNQRILPRAFSSDALTTGSFTPPGIFGLMVGNESSDPTRNTAGIQIDHDKGCLPTAQCGQRLRFWPLRRPNGTFATGSYVIAQDYTSTAMNYDFNDNIYMVTNAWPANAPVPTPTPTPTPEPEE